MRAGVIGLAKVWTDNRTFSVIHFFTPIPGRFLIFDLSQSPDTQIFNMKYPKTCKIYTGYYDTSEIKHGLSTCTTDNPLAKAW